MTVIWDQTVNHTGWNGSSYATAGWEDFFQPLALGLQPGSFWCQSLNGAAIDQAVQLFSISQNATLGTSLNVHSANAQTGVWVPSNHLITFTDRLQTYTRAQTNTTVISWRVIVTDQATTPPPMAPS